MKIQKKYKNNSKKRKLFIAIASLLAIAVVFTVAFFLIGNQQPQKQVDNTRDDVNTVDFEKPSPDQQDAGDKAKEEFNNSNKGGTPVVEPEKQNGKNILSVTIININSSDPNSVSIRSSVDTLETNGTCKLVITNKDGTEVESQQSSLQTQSSYSSCLGFTVAKSKLVNGPFKAKITYESSQSTGASESEFKL